VRNDDHHPTYTIDEFCAAERISRSKFVRVIERETRARAISSSETHRRITEQARQDWHRQLEAEATANIAATPTTPISRSGGK
jgi:hypothetical protein